jgi:hypothetical protein
VPASPDEPPPPVEVFVMVAAENCEIEGAPHATIVVPLAGKSAPIHFRVRGTAVGRGRIMVDFAQNGRPVGSVDLAVSVVAVTPEGPEEQAAGAAEVRLRPRPGPAPDVVIKVFELRHADRPGRLHFHLYSTHPKLQDLPVLDGDLGTRHLTGDVAAWVEGRLGVLGAAARRPDVTAEDMERTLAAVGCQLYEQLLPPPLQELSWTLRRRGVRSVLILSDEPHIPWELIKPFRADPAGGEVQEEDGYWGATFALTRWLRGRPPAPEFSLRRVLTLAAGAGRAPTAAGEGGRDMVLAPAAAPDPAALPAVAALPSADEELAVLRSLARGGTHVEVLPARRRALQEALERGEFDLLHLAGHGSFGGAADADASAVLLEDGAFQAAELSPRMAGPLRRAAPLVCFNACHSARLGFGLTRLGSWGARMVQMGCGGFVGALWPVTERAALAFARGFYELLWEGSPIGEALLGARRRIREQYPNDPSWLAYCCFADPTARVAGMSDSPVGEKG